MEEFAEVMELSRRSAFWDQEHFREAFPTEAMPTRMDIMSAAQKRCEETCLHLKELGAAKVASEHMTFEPGAHA